ncbi:MAG: hypothetical protein GY827_12420 [Cytophagales bacterium]|nr:hypothetical protein [Cytophagales bacterium]
MSIQPKYYWLFGAFLLKVLAGILVGCLYHFYYDGGDTLVYWRDVKIIQTFSFSEYFAYWKNEHLSTSLYFNTYQPRALFFVKVLSIFNWLARGNYWVLASIVSSFGFACYAISFLQLSKIYPQYRGLLFFALFINPSFVFWTSGLMKEAFVVPLVILAISCIILLIKTKLGVVKQMITMLLFFALCVIIWKIKYYFAATLFAFFFPLLLVYKIPFLKDKKKASYGMFLLLGLISTSFIHPNLYLQNILKAIVLNHDLTIQSSSESGYLAFNSLTSSFLSFLQNTPKAFFGGLFSPILFTWKIQLLDTLLNSFFLFMLIYNLKKYFKLLWTVEIWAILGFISLLAILLAFSSPNYGSLVRYRSVFSPLFFFFLFYPQYYLFPIYKEEIRHQPRIGQPTNSK